MRLFLAAYPPEPVCADLAAVVDGLAVGRAAALGVNARLAPRDNWHLTLVFLGEVPDQRADDAVGAVTCAVERWRAGTASRPAAPRLWLGGGGRFGRGRFTVLWTGVHGDLGPLKALHQRVRGRLRRARLPYDDKPLRPHLTLARPGDRVEVRDDLATLAGYRSPEWTLTELRLMRSHLGPDPRYDRIADIPLI